MQNPLSNPSSRLFELEQSLAELPHEERHAKRLELSNNRAERSIKPFVMGGKNFLFANTPGGAQTSATIYSLIETAKETSLDLYRYLKWVFEQAPALALSDERWAERLTPANAPEELKIPK